MPEPTDDKTEVSIEELQKKLIEQDEKIKELTSSLEEIKGEKEKSDKELKDVREINTKLLRRDGVLEPRGTEEKPETITEFVDSFIDLGMKNLKRKYGDTNGN